MRTPTLTVALAAVAAACGGQTASHDNVAPDTGAGSDAEASSATEAGADADGAAGPDAASDATSDAVPDDGAVPACSSDWPGPDGAYVGACRAARQVMHCISGTPGGEEGLYCQTDGLGDCGDDAGACETECNATEYALECFPGALTPPSCRSVLGQTFYCCACDGDDAAAADAASDAPDAQTCNAPPAGCESSDLPMCLRGEVGVLCGENSDLPNPCIFVGLADAPDGGAFYCCPCQ
jgi:hypothetical protein